MTCKLKVFCKQGDTCVAHNGYDIWRCTAFKDKGVPMTNEEWFCQLPTEEKAQWLEEKMTWAAQEQGTFTAKGWEMWLKQPHTEKE